MKNTFIYNDFQRGGYTNKLLEKPTEEIKNLNLLLNIPKKRFGVGAEIQRGGYTENPIKTRLIRDTQQLEAEEFEQQGVKVQFGDELLNKLIGVKIDDPRDEAWIKEYNRRKALGETEEELKDKPPLGRRQKQTTQKMGLSESNLKINDKIEQLSKAVKSGNIQSNNERAYLNSQIAGLMTAGQVFKNLTLRELEEIKQTIKFLKVPKKAEDMKLNRFYNYEEYKKNSGLINLFILGNINIDDDLNTPILSTQYVSKKGSGGIRSMKIPLWQVIVSLKFMERKKGRIEDTRILDIEKREIKPYSLYSFQDQQIIIKEGMINLNDKKIKDDNNNFDIDDDDEEDGFYGFDEEEKTPKPKPKPKKKKPKPKKKKK